MKKPRSLGRLTLFATILVSGLLSHAVVGEQRPFLLGGIQVNEEDHHRWMAALGQAGMNAVQVTVYAHQGPWNSSRLWFSEQEPAVLEEIRAARRSGLQVILVLRVALDHNDPENRFLWHGSTFPETTEELESWFRTYTGFVIQWARIAEREGVDILGIASEMNSLVATLPVAEVPGLAEFYLSDEKQRKLRDLVARHEGLFTDDERIAMGAGDFAVLDDFLVRRNQSERDWARSYTFVDESGSEERRLVLINQRRQVILGHWRRLIETTRSVFNGYLTLAANFDNYHEVAFWDRLDFIGINAYFPLRSHLTSPLSETNLKESWREIFADIQTFRETQELGQEILFTELGYTQRSGVTVAPWSSQGFVPIWEKGNESVLFWSAQPKDPFERALAVKALFAAWQEDRLPLAGILYWKLSSRSDLARYEPFMLHLGSETGDPLLEALKLFSDRIRPLDRPVRLSSGRGEEWENAILQNDRKALAQLLEAGRAPEGGRGRWPLLHLAVQLGRATLVRDLIESGADKSSRDHDGQLALHWACSQKDSSLVAILWPPREVSLLDSEGESPILQCARLDNVEVMAELLRIGKGGLGARNRSGESALRLAVGQASAAMVELLIAHDADPAEVDEDGATALHIAARRGQPEIVESLMKASRRGVRDRSGNPPVAYAAYHGKLEAFRLLWRAGRGRELNAEGQSLLHLAAHGGEVEIISTLLQEGLDVDQQDGSRRTPLHYAVMKGHRAAARLLLEHGAASGYADLEGLTILHLGAVGRDPQLVKLILSRCPELGATDIDGNTPMHHAAGWGRVENVRLLLAAGADPEVRNAQSKTPLQLAEQSSRLRMIELLRPPKSEEP